MAKVKICPTHDYNSTMDLIYAVTKQKKKHQETILKRPDKMRSELFVSAKAVAED